MIRKSKTASMDGRMDRMLWLVLIKGWVRILDLNETVAPSGTKEMVEDTIAKITKEN